MDQKLVPSAPILENELTALLQKFAKESVSGQQPAQVPANEPAPAPVVANAQPVAPEPSAVTQAAPAPVSEPAPVAPAAPAEGVIDSWDADTKPAEPAAQTASSTAPQVPQVDLSPLAKALGKETAKSPDELIAAVQELKQRIESFSTLPEPLVKAMEIAKSNGNYLEYLGISSVDWSKEDPLVLYENYVINQFTDPQGQVDFERVDKLLDKLDEDEKELRGRELQNQYINIQAQQKAAITQQAAYQKQQFDSALRKALDGLDKISDFKVLPSHKDELYAYISKGEDLQEKDIQSRVVNAFVKKYFNKLDSFRKTQIRNSVKKDILESVTVPSLNVSSEQVVSQTGSQKQTLDSLIKDMTIVRR